MYKLSRTFGENSDTATLLQTIIHLPVHLLLIDVRQHFERQTSPSFSLGLIPQFPNFGCPLSAVTAKLLFDPNLCIRKHLNDLCCGGAGGFWEHNLLSGFEFGQEAGSLS